MDTAGQQVLYVQMGETVYFQMGDTVQCIPGPATVSPYFIGYKYFLLPNRVWHRIH